MKLFVIPDVHLKPIMFDKAERLGKQHNVDGYVFLGDLVDDWGKQNDHIAYSETFNRAIEFIKANKKLYWCWGNHDISYKYYLRQTGFSFRLCSMCHSRFEDLEARLGNRLKIVHKVDKVLFSHAGLMQNWVDEVLENKPFTTTDNILKYVNSITKASQLWDSKSPLWARPSEDLSLKPFRMDRWVQVVGHDPVLGICERLRIVSTDTFSTYESGAKYGNETFIIIDTKTCDYTVVS